MIKEEVLDALNEVEATRNETEASVVESLMYYYDKQDLIMEYNPDAILDDGIIQESGDSKSSSVIGKIFNAIKKFIKGIISSIKQFFANFTNKASSSNAATPTESVSSIALSVLKGSVSKNKPDDINSWDIPKVNPKYIVPIEKGKKEKPITEAFYLESVDDNTIEQSAEKGLTVSIQTDPKSEIKGGTVKLRNYGIATNVVDKKIKISYIGFGKGSFTRVKDSTGTKSLEKIEGQSKEWYSSPKVALHLMTHDQTRNEITEVVELALKVMKHRKEEDINRLNKESKMGKLVKMFMIPEWISYEVSFDQITQTQKWASELLVKMDAFTSSDVDIQKLDKKTIKSLNMVVRLLMRIQISLNYISTAMSTSYLIDASFYKSIKSIALLDEFVGKLINAGYPPKYVAYNAWLISDECIRGSGKYKPLFGHARATIFPPNNKIVLKIALSGLGTVSNETEVRFTKIFVDMDRVDLIAPVLKEFKYNAIVPMERVNGDFDLSSSVLKAYTEKANAALSDYQKKTGKAKNIKISSQHIGNVAYDYKYKVYRSIDYGVHYRTN